MRTATRYITFESRFESELLNSYIDCKEAITHTCVDHQLISPMYMGIIWLRDWESRLNFRNSFWWHLHSISTWYLLGVYLMPPVNLSSAKEVEWKIRYLKRVVCKCSPGESSEEVKSHIVEKGDSYKGRSVFIVLDATTLIFAFWLHLKPFGSFYIVFCSSSQSYDLILNDFKLVLNFSLDIELNKYREMILAPWVCKCHVIIFKKSESIWYST